MNRRIAHFLCVALLLGLCGVSWGQKATAPIPADGRLDDEGMGLLRWTPGVGTLLVDVYLGTTPELGPEQHVLSTVAAMPLYFHTPGFEPGTTYYWRVDGTTADGTVIEGDVWMFMTQALTAYYPNPADGGSATSLTPDLTWLPGQGAYRHHVYFSDNEAAVADRTEDAEIGIWKDPNYAPDALQPISTYYWCVDEVKADDTVVAGEVWSFTTILPVDDFESYTNEVGERVFEAWVDGIGFSLPEPGNAGNGSGAAVGHDIWAIGTAYTTLVETNIVHSGVQSMPLYYDNVAVPYFSEAERTWAAAQNWTAGGVDALTLHVQGLARDFSIRTGTPVIDGEVDDIWADVAAHPVSTNIDGTEPDGPGDASGQFRVLYDAENLYALVDVNDEALYNDSGSSYLDDSVEFYVDGDNTKAGPGLTGNARQYTFGWTTTEIQGTNTNLTGVEHAQVDTATGWRIELKLPWQSLMGTSAPVGQLIGIDCFYNDDDDGADTRESQIAWHSLAGGDWETAASWGTALVAEPGAADGADLLYVALADAFNRTAVVAHPDPNVVQAGDWVAWTISLAEFTDVDMTSVKKMDIIVGDRNDPKPGGAGLIFVDDVYVSVSPVAEPNDAEGQ